LPAGVYTVLALNIETRETNTAEFFIERTRAEVALNFSTINDVTVCTGNLDYPNGSIVLEEIMTNGQTGNYTFDWFIGNSILGIPISNGDNIGILKTGSSASTNVIIDNVAQSISNINAGNYTVVITDNLTNCTSTPMTFSVNEFPQEIFITEISNNQQTTCQGDPDGSVQISASIDGVNSAAGNYDFKFFYGQNTLSSNQLPIISNPLFDQVTISGASASNLPAGIYTVLVTDNETSCTQTLDFKIDESVSKPVINDVVAADINVSDVTVCNGNVNSPNGTIALQNVTTDFVAGSYSFDWFIGNSTSGTQIRDGNNIGALKGNANSSSTVVIDNITQSITNLDAGTYTVIATDLITGCTSAPVTIRIENDPQPILIAQDAKSNQTNCEGDPNGSIEISATIDGFNRAIGGYDFLFYKGQNILEANQLPIVSNADLDQVVISLSSNNTVSVSALPAGIYTVLVTDNETNCFNTLEFTINENTASPVINNNIAPDLIVTSNTVCDGANTYPNGAIELNSISGTPGPFIFRWYFGPSVNAAQLITNGTNIFIQKEAAANTGSGVVLGATSNHIENLDAGFYTVVAINANTGCESDPITIEILDDIPTIPIIAIVEQDNFSCNNSTPTGRVLANRAGGNTGFTLEWFVGSVTATPSEISSTRLPAAITSSFLVGGNGNNIEGLPTGTYTVRITNNDTQCFETASVTVETSTPIITATLVQRSQVNCLPLDGGAIARGHNLTATAAVTATATLPAIPALPALEFTNFTPAGFTPVYTYQWYSGQSDNVANILNGETNEDLIGRPAGFYTVVVTEINSGCASVPLTIEIEDDITPAPIIDQVFNIIPSSCVASGGSITGTITALGNPSLQDYLFQWYEGTGDFVNSPPANALATGDPLATDPTTSITVSAPANTVLGIGSTTLSGLNPGLYTLVVENTATGCSFQEVFDLPFNGIQAATTIAIDQVDQCPDNGSVAVSLADEISIGYLGPDVDFETSDIITGSISGAMATVSFDGINELDVTVISGTFEVSDLITGSISGTSVSINTIGRVGFIANEKDDITQYEIFLYAGDGVPADRFTFVTDPITGFTSPQIINANSVTTIGGSVVFENLPVGTYTAIAKELATAFGGNQCFSLAATGQIDQRAFNPLLDGFTIIDNTNCDPTFDPGPGAVGGNGSIEVDVRNDVEDIFQMGEFRFRWFAGTDTTTNPIALLEDTGVSTSNLSGLESGQYTVAIERLGNSSGTSGNGCIILSSFLVQTAFENTQIIGGVVQDITNCNQLNNGSITINDNDISPGLASDYTFEWRSGSTTSPVLSDEVSNVLSDIPLGAYFVQATNNITGCVTPFFEFEVVDESTVPFINILSSTNNSSCLSIGNTGNGSISFDIAGVPSGDYNFQWFVGEDTSTPLTGNEITGISGIINSTSSPVFSSTLNGINSGTYTLQVTDATTPSNGCIALSTVVINEETPVVISSINSISNSFNCDGNGSFEVTGVLLDGISDNLSNYTFDFTFSDGTVIPFSSISSTGLGTNNFVSELSPGDYNLTITNLITACISNPISFTILDQTEEPFISLGSKVDDSSCLSGNNGNGSLSIDVTNGASNDPTEFDFVWYRGTNITAINQIFPIFGANSGSASIIAGSDNTGIENLSADFYTVVITDNTDPNNTCFTTASFEVPESSRIITATTTLAPATNCNGNGSFTISDVLLDGLSQGLSDYSFSFTLGDGSFIFSSTLSSVGAGTNNRISGLLPNDYLLVITDNNTDCFTKEIEFTIENNTENPLITVDNLLDDFSCLTGINGNGSLTLNVSSGSSTDPTEFDFAWYRGTNLIGNNQIFPVPGPNSGSAAIIAGSGNAGIENLSAGFYTVIATDNTDSNNNCSTIATFEVSRTSRIITASNASEASTSCDGNGSFTVTDVLLNGESQGLDGYTFAFTLSNGNSIISPVLSSVGAGANNNRISGLLPNDYRLVITANEAACSSSEISFNIPDLSSQPIISLSSQVRNSAGLLGNVGNGSLTVSIIDGQGFSDPEGFDLQWFRGNNLIPANQIFPVMGPNSGSAAVIPNSSGTGIEGLSEDVYTVMVTNNTASEASCISLTSFQVINDVPATITWTGEINEDWETPQNWNLNFIPTENDNVIIPDLSLIPNSPVIFQDAIVNDLTISTDGQLEVIGGFLRVNGAFTNNGSVSNLSGVPIVLMGERLGTGTETIRRNLSGDSPVNGTVFSDLNADHVFSFQNNAFRIPTETESLNIGSGYFVGSNDPVYEVSFSGQLNFGVVQVSLEEGSSFQLISNPYGASINVNAFFNHIDNSSNTTTGALYLWDDGGSNASSSNRGGDYITVNAMGAVGGTISLNDGINGTRGSNAFNGNIGAAQGFFIEMVNPGQLTFTPEMQRNNNNDDDGFFRNTIQRPTVTLSLSGEGAYDEILIGLDENATLGYDYNLDATNFQGNNKISFYSVNDEYQYAIQALPLTENVTVPLGLFLRDPGSYAINVKEIGNFPEATEVFITNLETGKRYDLFKNPNIQFDVENEQSFSNYTLTIEHAQEEIEPVENDFSGIHVIQVTPQLEVILGYNGQLEKVFLYDLSGRLLFSEFVDFQNGSALIPKNLKPNQLYLIKIDEEVIKLVIEN